MTDAGKGYLEFLRTKTGSFVSGLFSGALRLPVLGGEEVPSENFQIILTTSKQAFYGQSYTTTNATFKVSGICHSNLLIGESVLHIGEKRCEIEIVDLEGTFEYTDAGSVRIDGTAGGLAINGLAITPSGQISLEVIPVGTMLLDGISEERIQLTAVKGTIERLSADGSVKSTEELFGESIVIADFVGYLELEDKTITLKGLSSSVVGETFSW